MADGGRREARGRRATADDPRLDFFSRAFDARRALLGPPVPVPVPNARPLDNVAACRRLLPAGHPAALGPRPPPRAAPPPARPRRDADDRGRRPRLVDEIAERAGGVGPLAPLLKAYQDKGRVRVTTRHARGVRGVAEGTLRAFDAHMNLVLTDVVEHYTVRLAVERPRPPRADGRARPDRACHAQEARTRRLKAVFVRGDSVVVVAAVG